MKWSKLVLCLAAFALMTSIQGIHGQDSTVAPMSDSGAATAVMVSPEAAKSQTAEMVWSSAEQLQTSGLGEAAAQEYERIADQWPQSKQAAPAALQAAEIYQTLGKTMQALAACEKALAVANDFWAQKALFTKASICSRANCRDDAVAAIRRLRTESPESYWTVRSGVIEANLQGVDSAPAQAILARYQEANALHEHATQLMADGQNDAAIALLGHIVTSYSDSPAALLALDTQGHYLIRLNRKPEAMPIFADLLVRTGQATPQARIVRRAKLRLAALCRVGGRITEAQMAFEELAKNSDQPAVASNAALSLIGISYEQLRSQLAETKFIDAAGWATLRQKCRALADTPWCQARERIRAELVEVESYCWEEDAEGASRAGAEFIKKYDGMEFMNELVTARLFVGIALRDARRNQEALGHFQWIQQHASDPGPRVYLELWVTLSRLGAPAAEIEQIENVLFSTYPNSSSVKYIKLIKRQEAAGYVRNAR